MSITLPSPPPLRGQSLSRMARLAEPDVLVLGGGVNGIATLRDLALNGISAVLLDTGDFCAGASSASSRMAHGGLRYLEGREFRLVAESARERNRLLGNAPHAVHPLEIFVPLEARVAGFGRSVARFAGLGKAAGPLSLLALKGALTLYEFFGRHERVLPNHRTLLARRDFPTGLPARITAAVTYFDGQITQPEGLIFEMLAEAMAQSDQIAALNHVSWTSPVPGTFELTDTLGNGPRIALRPRLVVNASGAWIDRVNAGLGRATQYVRGVKGAHLVVRNDRLHARMAGRAFYFDDGTGRMIITLPVADRVLVGTTEVRTAEPDDHDVSDQEIAYLLRAIDGLFDDISVTRGDIVAVTSGIRPLRADGSGTDETSAARDHALEEDTLTGRPDVSVLSLVGGKWTTFRAFAEQTTDRVLTLLQRPRTTSTAQRRYPGAAPCTGADIAEAGAMPLARAEVLRARYGALALEVAARERDHPGRSLVGAPGYSLSELRWLIDARAACTVEDLVLRRTALALSYGLNIDTLRDLGALLIETLGRDPGEIATEILEACADPRIMGLLSDGGVAT